MKTNKIKRDEIFRYLEDAKNNYLKNVLIINTGIWKILEKINERYDFHDFEEYKIEESSMNNFINLIYQRFQNIADFFIKNKEQMNEFGIGKYTINCFVENHTFLKDLIIIELKLFMEKTNAGLVFEYRFYKNQKDTFIVRHNVIYEDLNELFSFYVELLNEDD